MKAFVREALSRSNGSVAPLRRELPSCANGTLLATG
jgi:hypothetical protein